MGDVIVETDRPESILEPSELVGTVVPRQGERLNRLGIDERQDRPESRTEHRLPTHQPVEIVRRDPVLPVAPAPSILAALAFDLDDEVVPKPGIQQKVRVLDPIFAANGPLGFVDGHARNPDRANERLEGCLIVIGTLGPSSP